MKRYDIYCKADYMTEAEESTVGEFVYYAEAADTIAALRAEVERLTATLDQERAFTRLARARAEAAEENVGILRARVEDLERTNADLMRVAQGQTADTIAALRAEVARLTAELAAGSFYKEADIDALMARAETAESRADAAFAAGVEAAAKVAACHADDRPRRDSMDWNDGYMDACMGAAAAIRALAAPAKGDTTSPIDWGNDPDAIIEDDEPQVGRDYE